MIVGPWAFEQSTDTVKASCIIRWEESSRADATIWFTFPSHYGDSLSVDARTALLAAFPLAMSAGERRIKVSGPIPSRLVAGVQTAIALIAGRNSTLAKVMLDVDARDVRPAWDRVQRDGALCLSGGVDAMAALYANLRSVPSDHPARYRYGVFVFGLNSHDFAHQQPVRSRLDAYEAQAARMDSLCDEGGVSLIRVATNLRALYPDFDTWAAVAHHTPLAAIGHALRGRLQSLAIASDGLGISAELLQYPFIKPLLSAHDLDVHAAQQMVRRIDKVRQLAGWAAGLRALRVCLMHELPAGGALNCGRCEKCVRTLLALMTANPEALRHASFETADVTPAQLAALPIGAPAVREYYAELVEPLAMIHRDDLADAIRRGLSDATKTSPASAWRRIWRRGG